MNYTPTPLKANQQVLAKQASSSNLLSKVTSARTTSRKTASAPVLPSTGTWHAGDKAINFQGSLKSTKNPTEAPRWNSSIKPVARTTTVSTSTRAPSSAPATPRKTSSSSTTSTTSSISGSSTNSVDPPHPIPSVATPKPPAASSTSAADRKLQRTQSTPVTGLRPQRRKPEQGNPSQAALPTKSTTASKPKTATSAAKKTSATNQTSVQKEKE